MFKKGKMKTYLVALGILTVLTVSGCDTTPTTSQPQTQQQGQGQTQQSQSQPQQPTQNQQTQQQQSPFKASIQYLGDGPTESVLPEGSKLYFGHFKLTLEAKEQVQLNSVELTYKDVNFGKTTGASWIWYNGDEYFCGNNGQLKMYQNQQRLNKRQEQNLILPVGTSEFDIYPLSKETDIYQAVGSPPEHRETITLQFQKGQVINLNIKLILKDGTRQTIESSYTI